MLLLGCCVARGGLLGRRVAVRLSVCRRSTAEEEGQVRACACIESVRADPSGQRTGRRRACHDARPIPMAPPDCVVRGPVRNNHHLLLLLHRSPSLGLVPSHPSVPVSLPCLSILCWLVMVSCCSANARFRSHIHCHYHWRSGLAGAEGNRLRRYL